MAKYIYFEKQGGDMMCGVHTLNALMQGPLFDEFKMAKIGLALDKEEQELLGGGSAGAKARTEMD
jgi:ataxin-3